MSNADLAVWLAVGFALGLSVLAFGHLAVDAWLIRREERDKRS